MPRLRLILLLIGGPILLLWMVDRAIVLYRPHWEWVVREIPADELDPYRLEAIIRTTEPGRQNVLILGDSTARASLQPSVLTAAFSDRGLRFTDMVLDGAATVSFGFLTSDLLALDPSAVILFVSAYTTRTHDFYDTVYNYDVRVVPLLFTPAEILAESAFHLRGAAGQLHVLFRHRRALQTSLGIYLGWTTIGTTKRAQLRDFIRRLKAREFGPVADWLRARTSEEYPNPNTRAIELLARRLAERRIKFILIESQMNPRSAIAVPPDKTAAFRAHVGALAAATGATFLRGPGLPVLTPEDFVDHTHLNARGRATFTRAVSGLLRETL